MLTTVYVQTRTRTRVLTEFGKRDVKKKTGRMCFKMCAGYEDEEKAEDLWLERQTGQSVLEVRDRL